MVVGTTDGKSQLATRRRDVAFGSRVDQVTILEVGLLAETQHAPPHNAPTAHALILDKAPVAVLLAVPLAKSSVQKYDGNRLCAECFR
jgi:hypothetical protein